MRTEQATVTETTAQTFTRLTRERDGALRRAEKVEKLRARAEAAEGSLCAARREWRIWQERAQAVEARVRELEARAAPEPTAEALRDEPQADECYIEPEPLHGTSNDTITAMPATPEELSEWAAGPGPERMVLRAMAAHVRKLHPETSAPMAPPLTRAEVEFTLIPCPQCAQGEERDGEWRSICSRHQQMTTATRETVRIAEIIAREVVAGALEQLVALMRAGCREWTVRGDLVDVAKRLREGALGGGDRG